MSGDEFVVMIRRGSNWEAVGIKGDQQHARCELAGWMRGNPEHDFAIARRAVPHWQITNFYPAHAAAEQRLGLDRP